METKSSFITLKCKDCSNTQQAFEKASRNVTCLVCDTVLAHSTGGKIEIVEAERV